MPFSVLRIVFKNGRIAEERGNAFVIESLFARDDQEVIDYIMEIDATGEVNIYTATDDTRFDNAEVIFSTDVI